MGSEPTIFLVACLVSLALTALIREIAPRIGLTDNPDGHRKLHGRATPLGGGVAVYLTFAVILGTLWVAPSNLGAPEPRQSTPESGQKADTAMAPPPNAVLVLGSFWIARCEQSTLESGQKADAAISAPAESTSDGAAVDAGNAPPSKSIPPDVRSKLRTGFPDLPSLLLAGLVIVIVGLVDDVRNLSGKQKLLGQVLAASILLAGGLLIERVECFGWLVSFGPFAYPITLFWLLGAINSLNLLDGIDGLATMLGIILSCTIAAMSVVTGNYGVAVIAMVFAGSLLGFMRYNFPPASIFLGDTGSMLIGLVVGALAIRGSLKGAGTVLLAAPLAVWTIPIFDSVAAILRRKLTGQSIYATDRGHLHHRLLNLLGSNRKVLGWVAVCCAVISVATLAGLILRDDRITLLTCFAVVAVFIATGVFGRVELLLIGTGLRKVGRMLVAPIVWRRPSAWQTSIQLQGMQQWELLWTAFVESADKLRLTEIRLDVNVPTAHEAYHASWQRPRRSKSDHCWRVDIPLVINHCPVGRVRISGQRNGQSACLDIQELMELIEPFEARIQALAGQPGRGAAGDDMVLDRPDPAGQPKSTFSGTTPK